MALSAHSARLRLVPIKSLVEAAIDVDSRAAHGTSPGSGGHVTLWRPSVVRVGDDRWCVLIKAGLLYRAAGWVGAKPSHHWRNTALTSVLFIAAEFEELVSESVLVWSDDRWQLRVLTRHTKVFAGRSPRWLTVHHNREIVIGSARSYYTPMSAVHFHSGDRF